MYAKIIADSTYEGGVRLTTMEVRLHRFVLAELNTHRVFSRNSASSRAIPLAKQIERVTTDPAWPVAWPREQKGMQGGDALDNPEASEAMTEWDFALKWAVQISKNLGKIGVHKSVVNRLLEPFMWHTVIITSTAWENFFGLRCNPMAQPEIRAAANLMQEAYGDSIPDMLEPGPGAWHLPYIEGEDMRAVSAYRHDRLDASPEQIFHTLGKISAARCARVSYLTQDGHRDITADIALYDRLTSATPMHASPLEHVASPMPGNKQTVSLEREGKKMDLILPVYGNLLGWHQMRFDVEIERGYQAFQ